MAAEILPSSGAEQQDDMKLLAQSLMDQVKGEGIEDPSEFVQRLKELVEENTDGEEAKKLLLRTVLTAKMQERRQETDQAASDAKKTATVARGIRARVDGYVQDGMDTAFG